MLFKDLPEGQYLVFHVGYKVSVQQINDPDHFDDCIQVVHDGRVYRSFSHTLNDLEVEFKTYADIKRERKALGAKISHVTRRLNKNEPLTGKSLKFMQSLLGNSHQEIAKKIAAGEPLTSYEHHLMVDMVLVHARF